MTADQVISLFVFDHGILHAISPINEPYNLTPRLIAEHREKTRRDIAIVAKVKRLERKYSVLPAPGTNAYLPSKQKLKPKRKWPSRKIPSRPFQTQTKRPR